MIDTFCGRVLYYAYLIVHRQPRVILWDALGSIEAGEMQGRGRSDVVCFLAIDRQRSYNVDGQGGHGMP